MLIRAPVLVNPARLLHHRNGKGKEADVRDPLPQRILIPVDVAEFRRRTFRLGVRLASLNDAEVVLLTVVDDRFPYPDIFSFHVHHPGVGDRQGPPFRALPGSGDAHPRRAPIRPEVWSRPQ